MAEITRCRSELKALMQEENTIIDGMAFFKIEEPHFKPVQLLEKVRRLRGTPTFWFHDKSRVVSVGPSSVCAGHRPPAAGVGDHAGLERQVGRLEGRPLCHAADGEHGGHDAGNLQEDPEAAKRAEGWSGNRTSVVPLRLGISRYSVI